MSDIHVLEGQTVRGAVHKRYAFHFVIPPEDRVAEAAQDPLLAEAESQVPNIAEFPHPEDGEQTELDAIRAAVVVEEIVTLKYHPDDNLATVQSRVRARYQAMRDAVVARYRERYRAYLTAFAAEA
jgi:hypothetical protein